MAIVGLLGALTLVGCAAATPMPTPQEVLLPTPISGNTGKYMSPYKANGTPTPWVDKAILAKLAGNVGKEAGKKGGEMALNQVPIAGGLLGGMAGKETGRQIAVAAAGGWDFINSSSDLSFNSLDDLAVYLYAKHSSDAKYRDAIESTEGIYPDLTDRFEKAIRTAPRKPVTAPAAAPAAK
ncbi:MAG: hypothetical protein NTW19_12310 [Planctomycetota bacterium]|nr:hypothetical protein [Planctomycetota bacterium]